MSRMNLFVVAALCLLGAVRSQPTLTAGVPVSTGAMSTGDYVYYRYLYYQITSTGGNALKIEATIAAGSPANADPDIYVSTSANPTSTQVGSPAIVASDTSTGSNIVSFETNSASAQYFIGIKAYNAGTFTVVATLIPVTKLTYDTAVSSTVAAGAYNYYSFDPGLDSFAISGFDGIVVTLTVVSGEPDLFVARYLATPVSPNTGSNAYSDTGTGGGSVTIPSTGWGSSDNFGVGVFGHASATSGSSYTIKYSVASSSSGNAGAVVAAFAFIIYLPIILGVIAVIITIIVIWCCCCKKKPETTIIIQQAAAPVAVAVPVAQ